MSDSLKDKASSALFWNFIDKGGQQVIQMIFLFVLARLLEVEQFGLIAILSIFTVLAAILQDSGFYSALVRKKDADEIDYSSVFYTNITISFALYFVLFFCAPFIADYFERPILTNLSRIVFLSFVFNAFAIIQNVHLTKRLNFKTNTKITFAAGLISGTIAIIMAYNGFGVWSLAVQQVLQAFIRVILLWLFIKWYPTKGFVFERIKSMFTYSFNLLINSLFNQLSTKIYTIIIGKHFSIDDAAYYDQAYRLNNIPQGTIGSSIHGVAFPVLSKIETEERLKRVYRKFLRIASFISFPIAILTIVSAESIVLILLSEKFVSIVPYLQILAIGWAFYPPFCLVNTLLQALGKSALILKIELSRSILCILAALLAIKLGIMALVAAYSAICVVTFVYGFYFAGKHISYQLKEIFKDIIPYIGISVLVFAPLYLLNQLNINHILLLTIQIVLGGGVYLLIIKLLGSQVLEDCLEFIKRKKSKK